MNTTMLVLTLIFISECWVIWWSVRKLWRIWAPAATPPAARPAPARQPKIVLQPADPAAAPNPAQAG